jgi:hypothetical protein
MKKSTRHVERGDAAPTTRRCRRPRAASPSRRSGLDDGVLAPEAGQAGEADDGQPATPNVIQVIFMTSRQHAEPRMSTWSFMPCITEPAPRKEIRP